MRVRIGTEVIDLDCQLIEDLLAAEYAQFGKEIDWETGTLVTVQPPAQWYLYIESDRPSRDYNEGY